MGASATFSNQLWGMGNNAGIVVPPQVVEALGAGKRAPVLVNVNGFEFRSTIASMGGKSMIGFSLERRKATGLAAGDDITVTLTVMAEPREVTVPPDFAAAMDGAGVRPFFDGLSNSLQRIHCDLVTGAKAAETRARRIDRAVGLFVQGKQR